MEKMFGKIQHKPVLRGLRAELAVMPANRFWGHWLGGLDVRDKISKFLFRTVVRGHEEQNLETTLGDIGAVMFETFQEG